LAYILSKQLTFLSKIYISHYLFVILLAKMAVDSKMLKCWWL